MKVAEVFGFGVANQSQEAASSRAAKLCPFRNSPCTKASKIDPLGICSLSAGETAVSLCPVRFLENDRIFKDAARIAFGPNATFGIFPEIRILTVEAEEEGQRDKKIGKVDFLIGNIVDNKIVDFAAIEVQAAYFSGGSLKPVLAHFMKHQALDGVDDSRRPDFRSSAQKRLAPQLALKVPIFRRWGKKFFVVVDSHFFKAIPPFKTIAPSNTEVTWLSYPLSADNGNFRLSEPNVIYSSWKAVQDALEEGIPPEPFEIIQELEAKLLKKNKPRILTL